MTCSKCGETGHNARKCPRATLPDQNFADSQDYVVWQRYGGMTKAQAKEYKRKSEDLLDEIAPNAFGVSAAGKASELPKRIRQAIDASSGSKQKQISGEEFDGSVGSTQKGTKAGKN